MCQKMGLGVIENKARSDQLNSDSARSDQIISTGGGRNNEQFIDQSSSLRITEATL